MKIILDVTGIKDHPDISSVSDYLEAQGFNCPYCEELDLFVPSNDSTDHGHQTIEHFYARSLKKSVPMDKTRSVTCHAAIGKVNWDKNEATLIVLADCEADDYAALERVIAEYKDDITNNGGDPNAEYEPSRDTQSILFKCANNQSENADQQNPAEPEKCPFCELKQEVSFGSQDCHMQLDDDGEVNVYREGLFQGAFTFPKCPLCGKDMKK
jgi:hypothetical protein